MIHYFFNSLQEVISADLKIRRVPARLVRGPGAAPPGPPPLPPLRRRLQSHQDSERQGRRGRGHDQRQALPVRRRQGRRQRGHADPRTEALG